MSASPSIRPAQSAPPDANDLPSTLQSIPAPRISLLPARSLLPDLSRYSLLAPPMGARRGRGHALLALTVGALAAGVVDGALGAEDLSPGQCLAVVGHCAAVMGAAGFVLGAALEGLLAAAARVVPVVRVWRWLARGPRAWFAPDPGLTTRLTLGLLGVLLVLGAVFLVSGFAAAHLHARWLVAVLVTGACLAAMTAAPVALVLLTAPLRALFARGGRLGSPGALGLGLTALLALAARAAQRAPGASDLFEVAPLRGLGLLAVLAAVALVAALALRRARPRGAPLGALAIAVPAGLLTAALAVSALTLGESRVVLRAAVARSSLSGLCVHALRRATDRDGDGASALFGGGDCDDGDARVHPGARDLPDNGVDENCSGLDGRRVEAPGDGHLARDTGLAPGARPSFVLITVDTLRPDHMSAYGYQRPTTPNVDVFARGAARFERAYAAVPRTIRSLSSIWTGRYPSHITWGSDILNPALGADNATLAETLSAAGYATAAFVDSNCFALTEGFFQGFGAVRGGDRLKGDARRTARAAADWITARGDAPFFAWIHLIEPHTPYRRHAAPQDFGDADVDRYDAEIAYADAALAPVLDAVARRERERPAQPLVTVLSADHGEGLHDHGHATHGIDLHEEAVHVPLLVRAPGVPAGPRGALVSLVDLHATVLNYAGLPPAGPVESRSLVDALRAPDAGGGARRAHLFTEVTPDGLYPYEQKSIIAPPWMLLWDVRHESWELYDIARDPHQRRNLIDRRPEVAAPLREDLLAWASDAWASHRDALLAAARLPRPPAPAHRLDVRFGDVLDLLGFDLAAPEVPVGGTIRMTLYYRVRAQTAAIHSIGLRFESDDPAHAAALDASHVPVLGVYRTTEWTPGEYLRDEVNLRVDPNVRPGRMRARFSVRSVHGAIVPPDGAGLRDDLTFGAVTLTPADP